MRVVQIGRMKRGRFISGVARLNRYLGRRQVPTDKDVNVTFTGRTV